MVSEQERREVECMVKIYPELQAELQAIFLALENEAFSHAVNPPEHIKANILKAIQKDNITERPPIYATSLDEAKLKTPSAKIISIQRSWAAAAVILIACIATGIIAYTLKLKEHSDTATAMLNNERSANAAVMDSLNIKSDFYKNQLAMLQDSTMHRVVLKGMPGHANEMAVVMWSPTKKQVYISGAGLTAPPEGKQYQLWAIVNGVPKNLGIMPAEQSVTFMQAGATESAQAFAITLEPLGGSEQPTVSAMIVMANA